MSIENKINGSKLVDDMLGEGGGNRGRYNKSCNGSAKLIS
jgi:hypothetical protein